MTGKPTALRKKTAISIHGNDMHVFDNIESYCLKGLSW